MPELQPWLPVLTLIGGYLLKTFSEWLQHRYTRDREREGRAEARRERLFEQRTLFQRETLLDLQEAMLGLSRSVGEIHVKRELDFEFGGQWKDPPEDFFEKVESLQAKTVMLVVRVRDVEVRELGAEVKGAAALCVSPVGRQGSYEAYRAMASKLQKLNERIGVVLRELDNQLG